MKRIVRVFVLLRHIQYEGDTVAQVFADEHAAAKAKEMNSLERVPGIDWIVEQHPVAYTANHMQSKPTKEIAKQIVRKIINDISDRSGLGNEWDAIDNNIQKEIEDEWIRIVESCL